MSEITQYLRTLTRIDKDEIYSVFCEVKEVDKNNNKCKVKPIRCENEKININEVMLGCKIDDINDFVIYPEVGSIVLINWISKDKAFIALYGDIDEIVINRGENGGLINIIDLVEKMNTIEADLNDLKSKITSWVPVVTDGGAALKANLTDWSLNKIIETKKEDIEDENFKH
jgi:hypothetical protein